LSHIQYTICRSGTYYYNLRVPSHAVEAYGSFIRQALSKCPDEAAEYAKRLGYVLEASWSHTTRIQPVDVATIIESFKPKSVLLSEMAEEYLALREIDQSPPRSALSTFISLAGDRDVGTYTREDAKLFVHHLQLKGNKTATIRRRINSLRAILNYAYAELDLDKRNPFTRLIIRNEGQDVFKRGTFTNGHPEALRRSLKVCRKLWAVSPKSFFSHLPKAAEACVARQVPSFRYLGYMYFSSACLSASFIATLAYPTKGNVRLLLGVLSRLIDLASLGSGSSSKTS